MTFGYANVVGGVVVPQLTAQESVAVILLAASILVLRTFRERYLFIWIIGGAAYFASHWIVRGFAVDQAPPHLEAISQAGFIAAVGLFNAAVFIYTRAKKLILPLLLVTIAATAYAALRALYWPDSLIGRVALEVSYRIVAVTAAVQLIPSRCPRWEIAQRWVCGSCLLHQLHSTPVTH